jgi:hypothetical protein
MASKASETVKVGSRAVSSCRFCLLRQHQPLTVSTSFLQVVVRCRPLSEREQADGRQRIVEMEARQGQVTVSVSTNVGSAWGLRRQQQQQTL